MGMEYKIERASEKDGQEMLKIIEALPSKGIFELLYTRRPDAYSSYRKESDRVEVGVIRDEDGRIAMQGACVIRDYYLNGESCSVGYLGGIRKRPDFKGNIDWMKMVFEARNHVSCDMFYCSILADNGLVMKYFKRKRKGIPQWEEVCDYTTYVINPRAIARKRWKTSDKGLVFRRASQGDLPGIHEFLNREGRKHDFFPKVSHLEQGFYGLRAEDCFLLERDEGIIAFAALWNQTDYRQYIVTKYNKPLNYMTRVDKLTQLLGYVPFPRENQVLDFPQLSLFLVENNDLGIYRYFLHKISREIKRNTDMMVIGLPNESPAKQEVFERIRSLSFESTLFFVDFSENEVRPGSDLFIECGLL